MLNRALIILFLFTSLFGASAVSAQEATATATLDTSSILIGDQIHLKLNLTVPRPASVVWANVADTITSKIEVIKRSTIDSVLTGQPEGMKTLTQMLTITSFDSGYIAIPPFIFLYKSKGDNDYKSAETEAILLEVRRPEVNLSDEIKDIKGPMKAPVTFAELLPWILAALGVALLTYGIIYYIRKRRKAEPLIQLRHKPALPPHVIALEALENLRAKKLWQSGKIKEYHTELTEIIRVYIEGKFKVMALEMVTTDILESLRSKAIESATQTKLKNMLELADMVKFAKEHPLPQEQEQSMDYAIDFVKDTIHVIEQENTVKPDHNEIVEAVEATSSELAEKQP
jgi:hypothetical protein